MKVENTTFINLQHNLMEDQFEVKVKAIKDTVRHFSEEVIIGGDFNATQTEVKGYLQSYLIQK